MLRETFICWSGIRDIEEKNTGDTQYKNCKGRNHPDIHLLSSVWSESGKYQIENRYSEKGSNIQKRTAYRIFPDCIISGEEKQGK